jgi:hypothetical protein
LPPAVKGLAILPVGATRVLYIGTRKGVWRSDTDGASWTTSPTSGLGYQQTAGVALSSDGVRLYCPTLGGGVYVGAVNATSHAVSWSTSSRLAVPIYHIQLAAPLTGSRPRLPTRT